MPLTEDDIEEIITGGSYFGCDDDEEDDYDDV